MVYIHIPFCGSFCTYCGFYSEIADGRFAGQYVKALCTEISTRKEELAGKPDTLYIGGGTPSVLPLSDIGRVVRALSGAIPPGKSATSGFREFTVEVNPEDIVQKGPAYVRGLASLGVNRISMGIQSFDDGILHWMNRRHDAATAVKAFGILREAVMENVSIDLIFGISHLDDALWKKTLDRVLGLGPQHISAYQLSVEPDSALAGMVKNGRYEEAPESQCSRQYDILCRILGDAGYHHYEISNFALPGYEAVHNSAYWRHVPYAGLGPGAHSLRIEGAASPEGVSGERKRYIRSWNIPDVRKYISSCLSGGCGAYPEESAGAGIVQTETLTPEQVEIERIMLGLRTDRGVESSCLESYADGSGLAKMIDKGFLVPASDPSFLRIPEKHFFISDSIIADII